MSSELKIDMATSPFSVLNSLCQYFGYHISSNHHEDNGLHTHTYTLTPHRNLILPLDFVSIITPAFLLNKRLRYIVTSPSCITLELAKHISALQCILIGPVLFIHTNRDRDHIMHNYARIVTRLQFAHALFYHLIPADYPMYPNSVYRLVTSTYNRDHGFHIATSVDYYDDYLSCHLHIPHDLVGVEVATGDFPGVIQQISLPKLHRAFISAHLHLPYSAVFILHDADLHLRETSDPEEDVAISSLMYQMRATSLDDSDSIPDLDSLPDMTSYLSYQNLVVSTDEPCSICFDLLNVDELDCVTVECGHNFHLLCITEWHLENNTCPLCRSPI